MRNVLKYSLLIGLMGLLRVEGQTISPYLFGQNSWMPHAYDDQVYNGYLDKLWPKIQQSQAKVIRIGGTAPDFHKPTNAQYLALVDSIRKIGAEPLIQVPYGRGKYAASDAAAIVQYLNITSQRNVRYWSISNEPNLSAEGQDAVPVAAVATYMKDYATAMKAVDASILVVGPECAWYDASYYNALIGGSNDITGMDAQGHYYLDIVSFHTYPFDGTQTRAQVVSQPSTSLKPTIQGLLSNISKANQKQNRTGTHALQWAITEFNINYLNPTDNSVDGNGVHGFLNGQFWAECFSLAMQYGAWGVLPWSIHESDGNRTSYDLGYLDNNTTFLPRSSFCHEMMLSQYFKGTVLASSDNQSLVKTLAATDTDHIAVLLMNQDADRSFPFVLKLDNSATTDTGLVVQVNAGLSVVIKDSLPARCTWVLLFDNTGKLLQKCIYSRDIAAQGLVPDCEQEQPYSTAIAIPGVLQAENYDKGGQNIGYVDHTYGNFGNIYRTDDVDLEACSDTGGGFDVGWTTAGEWLAYTINVSTAGYYTVDARIANLLDGGEFHLEIAGKDVSGAFEVSQTGDWQAWQTVSKADVILDGGTYVIRLVVTSGNFNLNALSFTLATPLGITSQMVTKETLRLYPNPAKDFLVVDGIVPDAIATAYQIVNAYGEPVQYGMLPHDSKRIDLHLKKGLYFFVLMGGVAQPCFKFLVE